MVFSIISVCIVIPSMFRKLDTESKSKLNAGGKFSYLLLYQAAGVTIRALRGKSAPAYFPGATMRPRQGVFNTVDYSFALTLLGLRGFGLCKRVAVINDHDHADSGDFTELTRREHRDANAAMAGGSGWNRGITVYGYAVIEIIRVVERSERALSPTFDLAIDLEPARRGDGLPRLAAFGKKLAGARRDRQNAQRDAGDIDDEQDLPV